MEDDNKLPYFLLGLGIGAALGVMFAPTSGEETRRLIRSKAEESAELLRRRTAELRDSAGEVIDRSKDALQKHRETLTAAVEAGRSAYREAINTPSAD